MTDPLFRYFYKERSPLSKELYCGSSDPKTYNRFQKITLPPPPPPPISLHKVLLKRKSAQTFAHNGLTLEEISSILFWSAGNLTHNHSGTSQRPHPSGGAKYPIELYPVIQKKESGMEKGIYHYNSELHVLERLIDEEGVALRNCIRDIFTDSDLFVQNAGMIVFLSFVKSKSIPTYGAPAYKLALIEAGHIGQNIYLISAALNLKCCALGIPRVEPINVLLGLDGYNETVCYAVALGK